MTRLRVLGWAGVVAAGLTDATLIYVGVFWLVMAIAAFVILALFGVATGGLEFLDSRMRGDPGDAPPRFID